MMTNKKTKKEQKIDYEVACMLNKLGYLSWDFSNDENNKKIEELKNMVLELTKTLPKA